MSRFRTLLKNSLANVASGAANALLAVVLPPFLVRLLPADAFNTWAIALQVAAIVNVFAFGVQVAVGRYVAHGTASRQHTLRDGIVSTGFAAMGLSAAAAMLALAVAAAFVPTLFPGMPASMHGPARVAILLIGFGIAAGLPASVAAGVFSGFQENEVPAMVVVGSRLLIAAGLIGVAASTGDLVHMAMVYAAINTAAALVQFALLARRHPELAFRRQNVSRTAARELAGYCFSLTAWSLAMLAISGLDVLIAGHLDFRWAGSFAIAGSVVSLLVGLQQALLQPLVAIAAAMHSRDRREELGALVVQATRLNTLLSVLCLLPIYVFGMPILQAWVGPAFAGEVLPILEVLLLGIFARQTLAPFATVLLGTGEQRLVVLTVLYEAVVKLVVAIGLGALIGPLGVAFGTVAGGLVCVASNLVLNWPRIRGFTAPAGRFLAYGIIQPALLVVPLVATGAVEFFRPSALEPSWRLLAGAMVLGAIAAWGFAATRRLKALI